MTKKESISLVALTIVMTFMEMSALPAGLFVKIVFADINPVYFALMVNFLIAFLLCFVAKQTILKNWNFGLNGKGVKEGLRRYGIPALFATVIVSGAFCVGLVPFDNSPTVYRVIMEGIVYYMGVAVMEELYLRGLLQNIVNKWFAGKKHAVLYAILITSILFGVGHIFGAIGQPVMTIAFKVIWATGLGVFFGAVYVKTENLWVPIILHFLIDLCGIPVCFSQSTGYPVIALYASLICFSLLGVYGFYIINWD